MPYKRISYFLRLQYLHDLIKRLHSAFVKLIISFAESSDSFLVLLNHILESDIFFLELFNGGSCCILYSSQCCHSLFELDVVLSVSLALYFEVVEFTDFIVECKSKCFNLVAVLKLFPFCFPQLFAYLVQCKVFFLVLLLK